MQTRINQAVPHPVKTAVLIAALVALVLTAIGFTLVMVQMQSAVAAYLSGQSHWSRAQVASVHHLSEYADAGDVTDLALAESWLTVLRADMAARRAMEGPQLDFEAARRNLIRGGNHPADITEMVWLYRLAQDTAYLSESAEVWRQSDPYVDELGEIADRLEAVWSEPVPNTERLDELRQQLSELNMEMGELTRRFRLSMTSAARSLSGLLSVVSIGFMLSTALLAWFLCWRLVRIQRGSERKFRAIFEHAAVGIAQVDHSGRVLDVNPALCDILKFTSRQILGMRYKELVHPDDWSVGRDQVHALVEGSLSNYTLEQRFVTGDGGSVWVRLTASVVHGSQSGTPYYLVILEDVSESRRLTVELSYQSTHDALTGLFNRRAFERRLVESLGRARKEQAEHALCLVNLDQFKIVNDTSGHSAGDQLLRRVVGILRRTLREGDMLARLGGDEFGIILENCDLGTASTVAEKVRSAIAATSFTWMGRSYNVSCSIGLVPITQTALDVESVLRAADLACDLAKEQGRNRVYMSDEDDQQLAEHHSQMEWLNRIRSAIEEDRMFLDAQLIAPTLDCDGLRYEVLVRLLNEAGEVVPPAVFLPAAERFGAAHQIDRWVIEHAFRQLADHPDHLDLLEACHINLSGRSFDHPDFDDFVLQSLRRYRIPPGKICFEITETAAVNNLLDAVSFMETLGKHGCSFALDDFGTGLSSFSYLRRLPVSILKIDGVFVRDIATDETDLAMVRAINEIGQTLNKKTIAEFVENDATRAILGDMGVDYVQGFGIHRPSRFEEVLKVGAKARITP